MNRIKVLKTYEEYQAALRRVQALMDATPGSPQEDELELLALLVETYEKEHFPIDLPDPVEAVLFRMEQQGLGAGEMVQYLGSQSKVSEVLNRKRPLSLSMIRSLHEGLGIPLEVLVQKPNLLAALGQVELGGELIGKVTLVNCEGLNRNDLLTHLHRWLNTVITESNRRSLPDFQRERLDAQLFKELAALSAYTAGPQMAGELLNKHGVHLIIRKASLPCEVDGACFFSPTKHPVIGLTLRTNLLEDFWFMLFHLLAHLYLQREKEPFACFEAIPSILDQSATEEESLVNEFLRHALAPPSDARQAIQTSLERGDQEALHRALQDSKLSPEVLACWTRLEKKKGIEPLPFAPRRISEKLEVFG